MSLPAIAGKVTDEILFEISFVPRFLQMNEDQAAKWKKAIEKTRQLPDYTDGTYAKMRRSIERILANESAGVDEIQSVLMDESIEIMQSAVDAHDDLSLDWARFDDALSRDQRKIFRSKISDLFVRKFKDMTTRSERAIRFDSNLTSDEQARRLGYSDVQREKIRLVVAERAQTIAASGATRERFTERIIQVLGDPDIPFMEIPKAMRENFDSFKITNGRILEYS
ncbi:MAG: hypothetical protein EB003_13420, partial [Flavobacteriia bacterium]|nr:hypothetical protein [Flavobacteriia bacterium]